MQICLVLLSQNSSSRGQAFEFASVVEETLVDITAKNSDQFQNIASVRKFVPSLLWTHQGRPAFGHFLEPLVHLPPKILALRNFAALATSRT
jgi:hypothetical protein